MRKPNNDQKIYEPYVEAVRWKDKTPPYRPYLEAVRPNMTKQR